MKRFVPLLLLLLLAADLPACKVPVFRYALERWPADQFRLLVANDGPFADDFQADLVSLRKLLDSKPPSLNLTLEAIDLARLTETERVSTPGLEFLGQGPAMVLLPPESWHSEKPVWSGPATGEELAHLLDSPLRQRCSEHILAGETAVWVLLLSGDEEKDREARALLEQGLELAASRIEIPEGVIRREDLNQDLRNIDLDDILRSDLPLRISFVIETLSREDPEEALFRQLLLGPAPSPSAEPLIVPIFGRGRTPGPVPASRLSVDRILAACEYLCGSCSCQVKQGNPGYDLLFKTAWDRLLNTAVITADSPVVQESLEVVTFDPELPATTAARPAGTSPSRTLLLGTALAILVAAATGAILVRRPHRRPPEQP